MAPLEDKWRHLAVGAKVSVFSNLFIDDWVRLSQSKKEL